MSLCKPRSVDACNFQMINRSLTCRFVLELQVVFLGLDLGTADHRDSSGVAVHVRSDPGSLCSSSPSRISRRVVSNASSRKAIPRPSILKSLP